MRNVGAHMRYCAHHLLDAFAHRLQVPITKSDIVLELTQLPVHGREGRRQLIKGLHCGHHSQFTTMNRLIEAMIEAFMKGPIMHDPSFSHIVREMAMQKILFKENLTDPHIRLRPGSCACRRGDACPLIPCPNQAMCLIGHCVAPGHILPNGLPVCTSCYCVGLDNPIKIVDVPENTECVVCFQTTDKMIEWPGGCGHQLCVACIRKIVYEPGNMLSSEPSKCPMCRRKLTESQLPSLLDLVGSELL